jgi:hypothetical protein
MGHEFGAIGAGGCCRIVRMGWDLEKIDTRGKGSALARLEEGSELY